MPGPAARDGLLRHFAADLRFFLEHVTLTGFDGIWQRCDCPIFENGQGLGLDKDVPYAWHTTSKTGLANPVRLLRGRGDCAAEVVYVTRAYLTRHGVGRLEEEVAKRAINASMHDRTIVPTSFRAPCATATWRPRSSGSGLRTTGASPRTARTLKRASRSPTATNSPKCAPIPAISATAPIPCGSGHRLAKGYELI